MIGCWINQLFELFRSGTDSAMSGGFCATSWAGVKKQNPRSMTVGQGLLFYLGGVKIKLKCQKNKTKQNKTGTKRRRERRAESECV